MSKAASPLLGYNNNVHHKRRVFHIQTEDSGVKHPHIITHLFMDGGRILKSVKTSYSEHVGIEGMHEKVRHLMKEQHKAMFVALRSGHFDDLFENIPVSSSHVAPATGGNHASNPPTLPLAAIESGEDLRDSDMPGSPLVTVPQPHRSAFSVVPPTPEGAPAIITINGGQTPNSPELALAKTLPATAAVRTPESGSSLLAQGDLPPPPANVLRLPQEQRYREITSANRDERHMGPVTTPSPGRSSAARPTTPARPAATSAKSRPQQGASLFGEDLISDKSLDDVILNYLAEDVEERK